MKSTFQIITITSIFLVLLIPQFSYAQISIGDIHAGGIVFYIDATGEHGKVIQAKDIGETQERKRNNMSWAEAVAACEAFGDAWYLPTVEEMKIVAMNLKTFAGQEPYDSNFKMSFYWSSTEVREGWVNCMDFQSGPRMGVNECTKEAGIHGGNLARAIRAF